MLELVLSLDNASGPGRCWSTNRGLTQEVLAPMRKSTLARATASDALGENVVDLQEVRCAREAAALGYEETLAGAFAAIRGEISDTEQLREIRVSLEAWHRSTARLASGGRS